MFFFYFIYIPMIVVIFLLLKIYTKAFSNKSLMNIFIVSSIIGLFTPSLLDEYDMSTLAIAYLIIATVIWLVYIQAFKTQTSSGSDADNKEKDYINKKNKTITPVLPSVKNVNYTAIVNTLENKNKDYKISSDYIETKTEIAENVNTDTPYNNVDTETISTEANTDMENVDGNIATVDTEIVDTEIVDTETVDTETVSTEANFDITSLINKFDEFQQAKNSKQYSVAMEHGKTLMTEPNLPKHFQQMLAWELADILLEVADYDYAISQLRLAISISPNDDIVVSETEARIKFIAKVKQELAKSPDMEKTPWSLVPEHIMTTASK